jgi:exonuclease VII large subunit
MALEALKQVMANSPEALKPQLDKAAQNLEQAGRELQKADPQKANQAQGQAQDALNQLMQTLEQAAAMAEQMQPPQQPGQPQPQPGEQPGQQPNQPTPAPERNETPGDGDRKPDSAAKTAKAQLTTADGDGTFLNLPARQRELIKQSLTEKLPPEYASFIQQYFVNVAKGKPAAKPAAEPARKQ